MRILCLFSVILLITVPAIAAENLFPDVKSDRILQRHLGGRERMSGYALKDFPDIGSWHFVTARYRVDTAEIRFTYANDLAWKALLAGGTDYPDGAVFAKTGIATREDPAFASSKVPSGSVRYQLMVRNKDKHKDTGGWGYALFQQDGLTFDNKDPDKEPHACHACHELVADRAYVFSQTMPTAIGGILAQIASEKSPKQHLSAPKVQTRLIFADMETVSLPAPMREHIPQNFKNVRMIQGALRTHIFQGTIDEIRPELGKEALRSGHPAALFSLNEKRFSMVVPLPAEASGCGEGKKPLLAIYTMVRDTQKQTETYPVSTLRYCEDMPEQ